MNAERQAAMQVGRERKAKAERERKALLAAEFCEWSKAYSQGKAKLTDIPCGPCDGITDDDFEHAREYGLIN